MFRAFRIHVSFVVAAAIACVSCSQSIPSTPLPPAASIAAGNVDSRIVSYANASRAAAGKKALQRDAVLDALALEHARETMRLGSKGHSGMQGRFARAHQQMGARMFAENVHSARPGNDPARRLVDEWMASKVHRNNLLSGAFNKTGVGSVTDSAGTIWAVQVFAAAP